MSGSIVCCQRQRYFRASTDKKGRGGKPFRRQSPHFHFIAGSILAKLDSSIKIGEVNIEVILLWALVIPTIRIVIYSVKDSDGIHWIRGNEASAAGAGLTPILVQALISVAILIVLWLICRAVERRKIGGAAARGGLFKSHALKVTVIVAAVAVVFVLLLEKT